MIAGLSPMDELDEVVARGVDPGAGGRRPLDPPGDRVPRARRAARRPRRAAGDRRRRVQDRQHRPARRAERDLPRDPPRSFSAACTLAASALRRGMKNVRMHNVQGSALHVRTPDRIAAVMADILASNSLCILHSCTFAFLSAVQMTQSAVVQYALEPMAVELREVSVPEIGGRRCPARGGGGVGVRIGRAPGVQHALVAGERAGDARVTSSAARSRSLGVLFAGFREGDRVVSETAAVICGACAMCRSGRYNLCPTRKGFGYGVDGAMAEFVKVPGRCLHHVPDVAGVRPRVPHRAACRCLQRDVRQRDDPARRYRGRARARTDRTALRAHGRALRRQPARHGRV